MKPNYDIIVIGAGHAGVEASVAAAKLGCSVLTLTVSLDNIGFLACNPSIGGTAKAHLVCEIDALGGVMGVLADETALQIRMLNTGKGAAVHSLRAQTDKVMYHTKARELLESMRDITLKQAEVIYISKGWTVKLKTGEQVTAKCVIIATGTYLKSQILLGNKTFDEGPSGFPRAEHLGENLRELGVVMRRFKTGTPPRLDAGTIDFDKTKPQEGDRDIQTFSFMTTKKIKNVVKCHLTYTNDSTHDIIRKNLHKSPMYSKPDERGVGARYCPSIEDKLVRFPEAVRHQIFLEPESLSCAEIYMQGMSTSLPLDVQHEFVATIEGLERAKIVRNAYAIEYDCIDSTQLDATMEFKGLGGLFFAGQINGTSGYEEAAAQGLIAGINAALKIKNKDRFELSRTESYIGVLIDDLTTKGTNEPYRMLTSRAEHRLYLRQDNADVRLTPRGREVGLACDERWRIFAKKQKQIENLKNGVEGDYSPVVVEYVETEKKYAGYIAKEISRIENVRKRENTPIPADIDYMAIKAISMEARTKLTKLRPTNIGQAGRISGVSPADVAVLMVWLRKK